MCDIRLRHVGMAFGEKRIFSDLSLTFSSPGRYAILGPSGRGKTTLLRLIAGLERPVSGEVLLPRDARIAFCFQEDRLLPFKTVRGNVSLVCGSDDGSIFSFCRKRLRPVRRAASPAERCPAISCREF